MKWLNCRMHTCCPSAAEKKAETQLKVKIEILRIWIAEAICKFIVFSYIFGLFVPVLVWLMIERIARKSIEMSVIYFLLGMFSLVAKIHIFDQRQHILSLGDCVVQIYMYICHLNLGQNEVRALAHSVACLSYERSGWRRMGYVTSMVTWFYCHRFAKNRTHKCSRKSQTKNKYHRHKLCPWLEINARSTIFDNTMHMCNANVQLFSYLISHCACIIYVDGPFALPWAS